MASTGHRQSHGGKRGRGYNLSLQSDQVQANSLVARSVISNNVVILPTQTVLERDYTQSFDPNDFVIMLGTDGTATQDSNGLLISSNPFTVTFGPDDGAAGRSDHQKWVQAMAPIATNPRGLTIFEAEVAGLQAFNSTPSIPVELQPRVRNINEDARLCHSEFFLFDPGVGMVYAFVITNDVLYGFHARLPFFRPPFVPGIDPILGDYISHINMKPLLHRQGTPPLSVFHKLKFVYDGVQNQMHFVVDNKTRWTIINPGRMEIDQNRTQFEGGAEVREVSHLAISPGFGTFSLLDSSLANNYGRDLFDPGNLARSQLVQLMPANFYQQVYPDLEGVHGPIDVAPGDTYAVTVDDSTKRLFGQGAELLVRNLRVTQTDGNISSLPLS